MYVAFSGPGSSNKAMFSRARCKDDVLKFEKTTLRRCAIGQVSRKRIE